jgi:site-specific recombinase XerD
VAASVDRVRDPGVLETMVSSFELHLRAEHKSEKTITTYLDAARWFAAHLLPAGVTDWADVQARHVQQWMVWLLASYADSYASNQFRALQQFFRWHATEDPDQPRPNPMAKLSPPKVADKLVPVITDDELDAMLVACKGG